MFKYISIIFYLLFLSNILSAQEEIKIVYNSGTPPYKFTDREGKANGMLIDIWKLWAQKVKADIVFIEASWDETLNMIKEGRAHIHAGIYYTKQRDAFLDYTNKPLYENKNYFFYNVNIDDVISKNDLSPFVIGIGNGYPNILMEEKFPSFAVKTYPSANKTSEAIVKGDVKVILSAMPTFMYYLKHNKLDENRYRYSDATFVYSKKYFGAVKQGNKNLLELINTGFEDISEKELKTIESKWTSRLEENYLKKEDEKLKLTQEELKYLKDKKVVNMCVDPFWMPFETIKENKHHGMVADIYEEFKKELPVNLKLIRTTAWSESIQAAKDRKCDILSAVVMTPNRKKYLNFTSPFLTFPQVIVTKENEKFIESIDDIKSRKIGVVKDSGVAELLKYKYKGINLVDVKNIDEGLFKVSGGELYGFVNTSAAVGYAIAKDGLANLKIASKVGIDYHIRVAVRNDEKTLLNIFEKVIKSVQKNKIRDIKDRWLHVKFEKSVDYGVIYRFLALFLLILAMVLFFLIKQNRLKKLIQQQKQAFENIYLKSTDPILLIYEGKFIDCNEAAVKMLGYSSKKEFLDQEPSQLSPVYQPDGILSKNKEQELLEQAMKNGHEHFEWLHQKANGETFWVDVVLTKININAKDIIHVLWRDIEERKKMEAVLNKKNKELLELNKQYQGAKLSAENANRAKSDFLAKMSHEIRTPMNAVLGMLYMTQKTKLDKIQENYISKADSAAKSLLSVINDILDFSKIEAGKLSLENKEMVFNDMLHETMDIMSFKAQEKGCELLAYYDKDIPPVIISDSIRIKQILNNLVGNAIKFTSHGEIVVSTKLVKRENDNVEIMFCIKDSGVGIDEQGQKKLFKDFSQVDDTITRRFGGTGLGLAISKKLSTMLGGKVWLEESMPNIGSTFCFTIKCRVSTKTLPKRYLFPVELNNIRVLIIDDNYVACDVMKKMIESFGFKADTANGGQEGCEMILNNEDKEYDLIFIDYRMPKLNGIESYEKIKGIIKGKTLPKAVMVTAYSQENILQEVISSGINGYLTKPVSPSTLYDTIMDVLSPDKVENQKELNKNKTLNRSFEGVRILLAEDNELNQEFAKALLESEGIAVDIANDGVEAVELVKSQSYDMVLMDIQMPNMDGLSASELIREMGKKDKYFKKLPIIALSANAMAGDKEKSLESGMNEHISKPIDPEQLFGVLENYIDMGVKPGTRAYGSKEQNKTEDKNSRVLDIDGALLRIGSNKDVYNKLLLSFKDKYNGAYEQITALIADNKLVDAHKKSHEIKGVAGNLGAQKLFETLSLIDGDLKKEQTPPEKFLAELKNDFAEVLERIEKYTYKVKHDTRDFDKEKVKEMLLFIRDNIEDDIMVCEDKFEELIPYLKNEEYYEKLDVLQNYFDQFNTDKIIEEIDTMLREIK